MHARGRGVWMAGVSVWLGGMHDQGGMHGRGGACVAGGIHGHGGGGGHVWQERWPLHRAVRILVECILARH